MNLVASSLKQEEYDFWKARCQKDYAQEKMRANKLTESEAKTLAESTFARLLTHGCDTPDHYIRVIKNKSKELVGFYWLAAIGACDNRKGFIYDIVIEESMRGKGYGKATMKIIEAHARGLNLKNIALHVFADNQTALNLYQSMNYKTTDLVMEKSLIE